MRLFRFIRNRKPPGERELQELYRSAEEGSPLPDVGAEARAKFEADQHLSGQISELASSAGPTNTPLQRSEFLSRVADEARRRPMEKGVPVLGHLIQKRTLAAAAAAVVLVGAVATVGAAGGAGQIASSAEDVLAVLQISNSPPKVDVCHVPDDNPDNVHTISVPENAVAEHLDHGDREGVCDGETPPGPPDGVGPSDRVDVCHVPGDNPDNARTISVPENAVEEHLAHGDREGVCDDETPPGPPDGVGPSDRVTLCHAPGDNPNNARTISVPENAVEEHLAHGDSEGVCDDDTPPGSPSDSPPVDVPHGPPADVPPVDVPHGPPADVPPVDASHGPPADVPPVDVPHGPPADVPPVDVPHGPPAGVPPGDAPHGPPVDVPPVDAPPA